MIEFKAIGLMREKSFDSRNYCIELFIILIAFFVVELAGAFVEQLLP